MSVLAKLLNTFLQSDEKYINQSDRDTYMSITCLLFFQNWAQTPESYIFNSAKESNT